MSSLLRESRKCNGRLVIVVGEAGIGKTRLVAEIPRIATEHDFIALWRHMIEDPVESTLLPGETE